MNLDSIRNQLPDYAKDIRLNLSSVLTPEGAPGLNETQIAAIALACAAASGNATLQQAVLGASEGQLDEASRNGALAAAAIMGMNNIYYRFLHLSSNEAYGKMPARLRMNVIGQPGIDKADFELYSLAVSAINGCGLCVDSHEATLRKHGVSEESIHSAVRIASVIHATARVLDMSQSASLAQAA